MDSRTYKYGDHQLTLIFEENFTRVIVEDLTQWRFPLVMGRQMTKQQAIAYKDMFEQIGYVPVA